MNRTNLKQQLMKAQLQELDRKKEKEKKLLRTEPTQSTSAINVPLCSSTAIPPQVLSFQSKLSNPTNYHVHHSKKRQVQEFLSQSHYSGSSACLPPVVVETANSYHYSTDLTSILNNSASGQSENGPFEEFWSDFENIPEVVDSIADSGVEHCFPTRVATISEENLKLVSILSPENVSAYTEDYESYSEKSPVSTKERSKKNAHNEVERKRRDKINYHIMELKDELPGTTNTFYEKGKDRQYKGIILQEAVNFLKHLKEEVKRIPQLEKEVKEYKSCVQKFLVLIQSYESTLKSHNIPVPQSIWHPLSESDINALIKQEPTYTLNNACAASAPHISAKSVTQFNNTKLEKFPRNSDQCSRPGRPMLQFLTVQHDSASSSSLNKHSNSNNRYVSCFSPPSNLDLIGHERIITDDVMLQARDSSTPEDMDTLS